MVRLVFRIKHSHWRFPRIPGTACYQQNDFAVVRWKSCGLDDVHVVLPGTTFLWVPLRSLECKIPEARLAGSASCVAGHRGGVFTSDHAGCWLETD